jgi:hypothetical protein
VDSVKECGTKEDAPELLERVDEGVFERNESMVDRFLQRGLVKLSRRGGTGGMFTESSID